MYTIKKAGQIITAVLLHDETTYGMCFVLGPTKVNHTIETGKGSSSTLVPMRIELLLRENIAASLFNDAPISNLRLVA